MLAAVTDGERRARELADSLPSTVRVGPFDFRLEIWTNNQSTGARRYGEFSAVELRVSVHGETASPVKLADTLIHELGHAVFFVFGIEDDDKEERIVGALATAWVHVYRDNPWLLPWLTEALR